MKKVNTLLQIDNSNLCASWKNFIKTKQEISPTAKVNYDKLAKEVCDPGSVLKKIYLPEVPTTANGSDSNYRNSMTKMGYQIFTKPLKTISGNNGTINKCNFDVEISVDAVTATSREPYIENFVLVSGDSDFDYLVSQLLHTYAVNVRIVSTNNSLSMELRNSGAEILLIDNIWQKIIL